MAFYFQAVGYLQALFWATEEERKLCWPKHAVGWPCHHGIDMLWHLINCRIIVIIIKTTNVNLAPSCAYFHALILLLPGGKWHKM